MLQNFFSELFIFEDLINTHAIRLIPDEFLDAIYSRWGLFEDNFKFNITVIFCHHQNRSLPM